MNRLLFSPVNGVHPVVTDADDATQESTARPLTAACPAH
jgi:hypothetical protein